MIGGAFAATKTLKGAHDVELPALSVAVHVTEVFPRGKVLPDAGLQVIKRTPPLYRASKFHVATAAGLPLVGAMVRGDVRE